LRIVDGAATMQRRCVRAFGLLRDALPVTPPPPRRSRTPARGEQPSLSRCLLLSRANRENFFDTLWRRFRKEIAEILVTGPRVVFFAIYAPQPIRF
jgi:hypothetical protein